MKELKIDMPKSRYGSKDDIIKRAEEMFNKNIKEMNELPFSMDMGYVFQLTSRRDDAELIRYILTGIPIPERK
jgi:hypothetical protein